MRTEVPEQEVAGLAQGPEVEALTAGVRVAGTGGSPERLSHLVLTGITADPEQAPSAAQPRRDGSALGHSEL